MCKRNARVKKLVRQKTRVKFAMNQQMLANPMVIKGKQQQQQQQQQERVKKGKFNLKYSQFHPYTWLVMKNKF